MSGTSETTKRNQSPATPKVSVGAGETFMVPAPQLDQEMKTNHTAGDDYPFRPVDLSGPADPSISSGGNSSDKKRKRGRPRKYPLGTQVVQQDSPRGGERGRGRPPDIKGEIPHNPVSGHIIQVDAGEDVALKVREFSRSGSRAVFIMSCYGALESAQLSPSSRPDDISNYVGFFDIMSLSGVLMMSKAAEKKDRSGGLSIMLAGPDFRVYGGCVAGSLIAASTVLVAVGRVRGTPWEEGPANLIEPSLAQPKVDSAGACGSSGSASPTNSGQSISPEAPEITATVNSDVLRLPWK